MRRRAAAWDLPDVWAPAAACLLPKLRRVLRRVHVRVGARRASGILVAPSARHDDADARCDVAVANEVMVTRRDGGMADARHSKCRVRKGVRVRLPLPAPMFKGQDCTS